MKRTIVQMSNAHHHIGGAARVDISSNVSQIDNKFKSISEFILYYVYIIQFDEVELNMGQVLKLCCDVTGSIEEY